MDFKIDEKTRLNFEKMMKEEGIENNTTKIRSLKHSKKIREQVTTMVNLRNKYSRLDKDLMNRMIDSKCVWLYKNYSNLFLKLKKNQLNLQILDKFLSTLSEIEEGTLDQHEGSVKVGQLLKQLYIDSAIKNKKQMEEKDKKRKKKEFKKPVKKLSWKQYKKQHLELS
tara:strand:- start:10368 stop:10871 length:504 start_codon:yes stop_codon:yes gene_type:complete